MYAISLLAEKAKWRRNKNKIQVFCRTSFRTSLIILSRNLNVRIIITLTAYTLGIDNQNRVVGKLL